MYILLFFTLLISGICFLLYSYKNKIKSYSYVGYTLLVLNFILFGFMSLNAEWFWFKNLGFEKRYLKQILLQFGWVATLLTIGLFSLRWLLSPLYEDLGIKIKRALNFIVVSLALFFGLTQWMILGKFLFQRAAEYTDPLFGFDISFFFFTVPFLEIFIFYLFLINIICLVFSGVSFFQNQFLDKAKKSKCFRMNVALFFIFFSINQLFLAVGLVNSSFGIVHGAGWSDIYIRLPAYLLTAIVFLFYAIKLLFPIANKSLVNDVLRPITLKLCIFWGVAVLGVPWLVQTFYVVPNEITLEKRFLKKNIEFTRKAYNISNVQEKVIDKNEPLTKEVVNNNKDLFDEIRLWDWRALHKIYDQFQEIRLYYQFADIDIDRYKFNGKYRQVMLGAREISLFNLPKENQTFVNRRFKYTHGYGLAMSPRT